MFWPVSRISAVWPCAPVFGLMAERMAGLAVTLKILPLTISPTVVTVTERPPVKAMGSTTKLAVRELAVRTVMFEMAIPCPAVTVVAPCAK